MPDLAALREELDYDPDAGEFRWSVSRGRVKAGSVAGIVYPRCMSIRWRGRLYKAHRLAWFYVHGYFPREIDHINCNPVDNRFANLREATRSQNQCNHHVRKDNKSGLKGVYLHQASGKWAARIKVGSKRKSLGYFDTPEAAHIAYCAAAAEGHGEFARFA